MPAYHLCARACILVLRVHVPLSPMRGTEGVTTGRRGETAFPTQHTLERRLRSGSSAGPEIVQTLTPREAHQEHLERSETLLKTWLLEERYLPHLCPSPWLLRVTQSTPILYYMSPCLHVKESEVDVQDVR